MTRDQLDRLKWLLMIRTIDLRATQVAAKYTFGPLTRRYGFGATGARRVTRCVAPESRAATEEGREENG